MSRTTKTYSKLLKDAEKAERKMVRSFNAWVKMKARLKRADAALDKQFAESPQLTSQEALQ